MINIIMPTYNDEKTIISSIKSVINQSFNNWHLYVVNDGSTDNTENVLEEYIKDNKLMDKITYIKQENQDQLNAIINASNYIEDENSLVYILHSDDILNDNNVLQNAHDFFETNSCDAIISDYDMINEKNEIIGTHKVKKYEKKDSILGLQTLWLGRNLFTDMAFWKFSSFKDKVMYNYLMWNTPFWMDFSDGCKMLDVKNVNFKFFKYRVFDGNYINNQIGLLNVLNGELRTETNLLKYYDVKFFKLQYYIFRIFNKIGINYNTFYLKKESKNKYKIIKFLINKRIKNIKDYDYYYAILNFYKFSNSKNALILDEICESDIFLGADIRKFNNLMVQHKLPEIYYKIFDSMNNGGFSKVLVSKDNYNLAVKIIKFLNIYNFVDIEFLEKQNN